MAEGGIVVTGFGPFPGVPDNPSQAVLARLAEGDLLPAGSQCQLVKVRYTAVPEALDAILTHPPAALVLTGFSGRAEGLRLETRAHDFCSTDREDAFGFVPAQTGAPPVFCEQRNVDLSKIALRIADAGIACTTSDDGGAYVCNHIYHEALSRIEARGLRTLAVFVHMPALEDTPLAATSAGAMPLDVMARGVAIIADALVCAADDQRRA